MTEMFTERTRIRPAYITGPCPYNQTLCERIANERSGDALSDCPLCYPYALGKDTPPNYPVPAIRYIPEWYDDAQWGMTVILWDESNDHVGSYRVVEAWSSYID